MRVKLLNSIGTAVGAVGVALCVVSGAVRLGGVFHIAGFELRTLFLVGIGLMVMGCLAKLHVLVTMRTPGAEPH
jgi:hypothetical protein